MGGTSLVQLLNHKTRSKRRLMNQRELGQLGRCRIQRTALAGRPQVQKRSWSAVRVGDLPAGAEAGPG